MKPNWKQVSCSICRTKGGIMENEILIAENVEIDMETLCDAQEQDGALYRWKVIDAVIKGLSPEDRKRLEEYGEQ